MEQKIEQTKKHLNITVIWRQIKQRKVVLSGLSFILLTLNQKLKITDCNALVYSRE